MSATITGLTVSINGGDPIRCALNQRQEVEYVSKEGATKPDLSWTTVDNTNHFHAYTADGKLPTLRPKSIHVPCDGCGDGFCEGYDVTEYHCSVCDQIIEPARVPDYAAINGVAIPGRRSWSLTVHDVVPMDYNPVSVVVRSSNGHTWFGFAICTGAEETRGLSSRVAVSHLEGTSELGQMTQAEPATVTR